MKKLTLTFVLFLSTMFCFAQAPQFINFQGIVKDANGKCLQNQSIQLELTIYEGDPANNIIVYEEDHTTTTDDQGLFAVKIGAGTASATYLFADIDWSSSKSIRTEVNGSFLGIIPLQSVPYTFFADIADSTKVADMAWNGKLTNGSSTEVLKFYRPNGILNTSIGGGKYGLITVHDSSGNERGRLVSEPTQKGAGVIFLRGPNSVNYLLGPYDALNPDLPAMALGDENTSYKVRLFIDPTQNDNGSIGLYDNTGTRQAAMYINSMGQGIVEAGGANGGVKNFVMPHPYKLEKNIAYACIEGPEAAAYERGSAELVNGEAFIPFSEHFEIVINAESLTVTTSPWSASSKGLAIVERSEKGFKVKELFDGKGNYKFDWEAKAVRKGFEDYKVIRNKED